jgi:hypothetical protein
MWENHGKPNAINNYHMGMNGDDKHTTHKDGEFGDSLLLGLPNLHITDHI